MAYFHKESGLSLYLIGGVNSYLFKEIDEEEYTRFLEMGILFLKYALGEPPPGSWLKAELISDSIVHEKMIVLAFTDEPDEAKIYALKAEDVLSLFANAVDWDMLRKERIIKFLENTEVITTKELLSSIEFMDDTAG